MCNTKTLKKYKIFMFYTCYYHLQSRTNNIAFLSVTTFCYYCTSCKTFKY